MQSIMKTTPEAERFERYQTVVHALLERNAFHKKDLYSDLDRIKMRFIGRAVKEFSGP
jgi:hypothetical protein